MEVSRRDFLKTTALTGTAFVLGLYLPEKSRVTAAESTAKKLAPNAFVRIGEDNRITFLIGQAEMGQNTFTTLSMCIAEDLDADWEKTDIISAPVHPAYNHAWAPMQLTGGSSSIYTMQAEMRKAGASIRQMLMSAAARRWNTQISRIKTKDSMVLNPATGARLTYGDLIEDIANLEVPQNPKLKSPEAFKLIGKPVKRHPKEAWAKVRGEAEFGIDVRLENQKYAAMIHPPVFGATVKNFDGSKALQRQGVHRVKQTPFGIAVIADHWWQAKQALDDVRVVWNAGEFKQVSSESLRQQYRAMMEKPGASARKEGDTAKAFQQAAQILEADYEFPFLAHAPMEPLNCTVHDQGGKAGIWTGGQMQTVYRNACAEALGLEREAVTYHNTYLGGGFGRRAVPNMDFILDAVFAAKGEPWPVMTLWAREDDIRMGNYRPLRINKVRVALDQQGNITALESKLVGQSIMADTMFASFIQNDVDPFMVEGLATHHYDFQNNDIQVYRVKLPIVPLWWRSVGHTHTAPVVEGIIDEAAHAAGRDPVDYRLNLLTEKRMVDVLEDVARISGWKTRKKEQNVGYGVAVVESFKSFVAQVAKVRVSGNQFEVEKVWCSVDCGFAFNPLNVENQMMGGIHFGLGPVKFSALTVKDGMVEQSNFHDYKVVRMSDAPDVEVSILNSGEEPGGIGEPGTPPIIAAVANAIFDATGKRYRSQPIEMG